MLKEDYLVEKSRALVWAKMQNYSTGELKVLDTYLSRIDARRPESALVTFTKKEYTELMGIDPSMKKERLKRYTKGLLSNIVTIDLPNDGYVQYPLFSLAECTYEKNNMVVKIACNERLLSAFFELAEDKYVTYRLKNIIAMNGQYSIRLYTLLKDKHFSWKVPVDELREILGATTKAYKEFKDFNRLIIKRAVEEINEITDIFVEVEYIKKGRPVEAVKFKIKQKQVVYLPKSEKTEAEQEAESVEGKQVNLEDLPKFLRLSAEVLPDHFTENEIALLHKAATDHVPFELDQDQHLMNIREYLTRKVMLMKASKIPVKEKGQFTWLRRAVEEDW